MVSGDTNRSYLIPTALSRTWPSQGRLVFLGGWCKRYAQRSVLEDRQHVTVPYHWDDREKMASDYVYLQRTYEELMPVVANALNTIHNLDRTERFWRIVCGWWLRFFLQVLFDRSECLSVASSYYPDATYVAHPDYESPLPCVDTEAFSNAITDDAWNQFLFQILAKNRGIPPSEFGVALDISPGSPVAESLDLTDSQQRVLPTLSRKFLSSDKATSSWTGENLTFRMRAAIALSARQRVFNIPQDARVSYATPPQPRNWRLDATSGDHFVATASRLIPDHIPIVFVEGFGALSQAALRRGWPRHPKSLVTSNALIGDEVWKRWAAEKVEIGSQLVVRQHGGHYGVADRSSLFDHEIDVCNRYLSWGWGEGRESKVHSAPAVRLLAIPRFRPGQQDDCLLICTSYPRYSYWLGSHPIAAQFEGYLENQFEFVTALSPHVRSRLKVRLYSHDFGWDQKMRWQDRFPDIALVNSFTTMSNSMKSARLCVSTQNSTSILECMARGYPTVAFWDPRNWELSSEAAQILEPLRDVGILHASARECASKVNQVFSDAMEWWSGREVQDAVTTFVDRYARIGRRPFSHLVRVIGE